MKRKVYINLILISLFVSLIIYAYPPKFHKRQGRNYLKLASWNIRIFSNNRTDEELRKICKIAKDFDFIAIIELRDEEVLKRMVNMLRNEFGKNYNYELSPYVGGTSHKELYAFLYNTDFITLIEHGQLFYDNNFYRMPFYATFKAGNFDFTIIVVHIIWGNSVTARRKEIKRLAYVYNQIQNKDPNENDIILVGDFNRDPNDDLAWAPMKSIYSMIHLFDLPEKSMIWDSHLYDNIWFQSNYVSEFSLDRGIIRFDELDFDNNDYIASKEVSDHRPVWGFFKINLPDDD